MKHAPIVVSVVAGIRHTEDGGEAPGGCAAQNPNGEGGDGDGEEDAVGEDDPRPGHPLHHILWQPLVSWCWRNEGGQQEQNVVEVLHGPL